MKKKNNEPRQVDAVVKPRIGDMWEYKLPGKSKKQKIINDIWMKEFLKVGGGLIKRPYCEFYHEPKGRTTGMRAKVLMKYGTRISTEEERKNITNIRRSRILNHVFPEPINRKRFNGVRVAPLVGKNEGVMPIITVSKNEQKAIKELQSLAKRWPKTLGLFSFSGSLCVTKKLPDGRLADIQGIQGIFNDGGDPRRR